jgi:hypothetical protein
MMAKAAANHIERFAQCDIIAAHNDDSGAQNFGFFCSQIRHAAYSPAVKR